MFRALGSIVVVFTFGASLSFAQTVKQDSASQRADNRFESDTSKFIMQHSVTLAVVGAALLPGFGQVYNEEYWKLPFVYGFGVYFASVALSQNSLYVDAKYSFDTTAATSVYKSYYKKLRDFYRDQRDEFLVYLTITYLAQILDAYVGAHLYDFNTVLSYDGRSLLLGFRYHF